MGPALNFDPRGSGATEFPFAILRLLVRLISSTCYFKRVTEKLPNPISSVFSPQSTCISHSETASQWTWGAMGATRRAERRPGRR